MLDEAEKKDPGPERRTIHTYPPPNPSLVVLVWMRVKSFFFRDKYARYVHYLPLSKRQMGYVGFSSGRMIFFFQ